MNWAELKRDLAAAGSPLAKLDALMRWIDRQDNWASAIGHGLICLAVMTVGVIIAGLQYAAFPDREMSIRILVFFAGLCIGGYTLRESDDARKARGTSGEGRKLAHGFEDWIAPVVTTVASGVFYASLIPPTGGAA